MAQSSLPLQPLSVETLTLLRSLLASQQLQVGAPNFPEMAQAVLTALAELDTALQDVED